MIDFLFASRKDMNEVAEVHLKCFPDSFSSCLKNNLLSLYYQSFFDDYPDYFMIAREGDKIVGFVMGYPIESGSSIKKFKNRYFLRILFRVLFQLIKFDARAWKYIFKIFKKNEYVSYANCDLLTNGHGGDLLSICVLPDYRKAGIASKLESEFCSILVKKEMDYCALSSLDNNIAANSFYKKHGYQQVCKNNNSIKWIKRINN